MLVDNKTGLIIDAIEKFGGEARFVGGCVRDSILKRNVHDIDFATNLLPSQVTEALERYNIKSIPTGLKHGTITAVLNHRSFEITTLRRDVKCDGRHAEVRFTDSWKEDASRRDFTFNALYADKYGNIYDYFCGIKDLEARRLNFIGNAEDRIREDYLRILRAFRFHAKICLGDLSSEILKVCKAHSHMIQSLSGERIRDEIFKLLECNNPPPTLANMQQSDVLQQIIPEEVDCQILSSELLADVEPLVKLALLLRTTQNQNLGKYMSKFLRLSNKQREKLLFLLSNSISTELSEREQKKYILQFGTELYCDLIRICGVELKASTEQYILFAQSFTVPKFPLSGNDLIRIGYQPGKNLGKKLELLKRRWEDSSYILTKDELISYAKNNKLSLF
ncbi:MAG: CCA tRNA nucleotidyltransferase [Wolbachia endosymbiont of Tyrophagus putrescentiae]|nr:CCA tRNA nucleotidyltransferase [Wolbachia endosymbiont of Tyrophagus putrescentiae]